MRSGPRYAIYFVPPPNRPLFQFGRAVLGYDCYSGEDVAHPCSDRLAPGEWAALTGEPRIYGFHATLKAPFHLIPPIDEAALVDEFSAFAAGSRPIPAVTPCIRIFGSFIALVPCRPCRALDNLAAQCVTEFDRFRAPLTPTERERRMGAGLTPTETANLDRWGYPYVFESFRFHMTLTGPIVAAERRVRLLALLQDEFNRQCGGSDFAVDRVALLRQDQPQARFRVLTHAALGG